MEDNIKKLISIATRSIAMKISIATFGIVVGVFLAIIIIITSVLSSDDMDGGGMTGGGKELPEDVMIWEDDILEEMIEQSLDPKYLDILLAILYQESKGNVLATDGDIFQASESKCGEIDCITDPLESIAQGVSHFKSNVSNARENTEVAVASYNFGNGFASWTQENHENKWSLDIAIEYSAYMMGKVENPDNYSCNGTEAEENGACYGDIHYVTRVMSFVEDENESGIEVEFDGELEFPLDSVYVTSNYGNRLLNGELDTHNGIDLRCTNGLTPILSSGDGEVVYSGFANGYGNTVIVEHDEKLFTLYAHMSNSIVASGDFIKMGQQVGMCGATGGNYAPHLHFETKKEHWGGFMNPRDFLDFPPKGEYK